MEPRSPCDYLFIIHWSMPEKLSGVQCTTAPKGIRNRFCKLLISFILFCSSLVHDWPPGIHNFRFLPMELFLTAGPSHSALNPIFLCVPSQNGLLDEPPHRHNAIFFDEVNSPISGDSSVYLPSSKAGPFFISLISRLSRSS